jgi:hypothetical protein
MSDPSLELGWYLSRSGPRAEFTTRPDLTAVARAVARYAHDPDDPREARRYLAQMTREDVASALREAEGDNPLLLSAAKRKRVEPLPDAAEKRLLAAAGERVRELYPESARVERAADVADRQQPGVRAVLRSAYPGSGAGRPRVPETYPLLLRGVSDGLWQLWRQIPRPARTELEELGEDLHDCISLCDSVLQACEALRQRGQKLCGQLHQDGERQAQFEAERIEARLKEGELPYPNSSILPVGPYGMSVQWGLEPAVHAFAETNQNLYEEIDRYGALAMERAKTLARRASRLLGPYVADDAEPADNANAAG